MAPYKDSFLDDKKDAPELLQNQQYAYFDNYFAIKTFPEYKTCQILDVPKNYNPAR